VLPAAVRYQTELATNVGALTAVGVDADMTMLEAVSAPLADLRDALRALEAALDDHSSDSPLAKAEHARDQLLPAMAAVRTAGDQLETVVADDLWDLPTYQEMLYIL
jgi:glutamine synthetase